VSAALKVYPNVREPDVLWRAENATAHFASPLVHDGCVYLVNKPGFLYCLDLATGRELWTAKLNGEHWAAPMAAGERVYFFGVDGTTTVFAAGPKPKKLAENVLPEAGRLYAAAPLEGGLLFRTPNRLLRVSAPAAAKPKYEWKPVG
jgi:outer membrane protein assembly factor BamB